jgi:integrase/predicted RNA-binding Zn-ribbon protein involved in translation (DUF1610 family)
MKTWGRGVTFVATGKACLRQETSPATLAVALVITDLHCGERMAVFHTEPQIDSRMVGKASSNGGESGVFAASAGISPLCPECGSQKLWRDGLRYSMFGDGIQRWLCRNCGLRFSDSRDVEKAFSTYERLQRIDTKSVKAQTDIVTNRQICVTKAEGTKNLAAETELFESAGENRLDQSTIKGKLVQFSVWMKMQGYTEETVEVRTGNLLRLARLGANICDPESVKEALSKQKWKDSYKMLLCYAYEAYMTMEKLQWIRPRYAQGESFPFIPTEQELDQLISATSKKLSTFLQGLKDTGADPGELIKLRWIDINKESKTLSIRPIKHHNPRISKISEQFLNMLERMPKTSELAFKNYSTMKDTFFHQRKRIAEKFSNPRLRKISFTTFRHWKGTIEYHRTKDILYVKKILGHKTIQNTLKYIDLEATIYHSADDKWTVRVATDVKEACTLTEAGFEYVTGEYSDGGKIFRKRN